MWSLLSTTKQPFTIPNILPYVHHWQCGLCCPLPKSLLQYLTSYHMSITTMWSLLSTTKELLQYLTLTICPSLTMWSLLSTTKHPFTIPNILPYVHHWQCSLCCPLPKSFTIPNILPYVHHWQCGLCCPLPKSLLQYLTSYHMSITDNVAFVVHYQRVFYNT